MDVDHLQLPEVRSLQRAPHRVKRLEPLHVDASIKYILVAVARHLQHPAAIFRSCLEMAWQCERFFHVSICLALSQLVHVGPI